MATVGKLVVLGVLTFPLGCVGSDAYVTPAPEGEPPAPSGASEPSADDAGDDGISVVEIAPPDDRGPEAGAAQDPCADGRRHYATVAGSTFSWTVKKADGSPVVGVHTVAGSLALTERDPLAAPALELSFNKTGRFTGQELRDERLGSAFFGVGDALRFKLRGVRAAGDAKALPEAGNSLELTLAGTLEIAGKVVDVEVPVLLSRRGAGLHVSESSALSYKLRTDWGLSTPLDAFLALAQAKIEESVSVRFALDLAETCGK